MVRATVSKMAGISDILVDSTSVAIIRMAKADQAPNKQKIDEAIKKYGLAITSLDKVERAKPIEVWEVAATGFS